jgi:hypothetical protein
MSVSSSIGVHNSVAPRLEHIPFLNFDDIWLNHVIKRNMFMGNQMPYYSSSP